MESMGERIRRARTEAALTPEQLAQRCGVGVETMAQWEAADPQEYQRPSLDNLRIIARETGFLADWLSTGRGPKRIEEDRRRALVLPLGLTDEQADVLYVWGGLEPELKLHVMAVMKACSKRDSRPQEGDAGPTEGEALKAQGDE